jgi:hypothetical protein
MILKVRQRIKDLLWVSVKKKCTSKSPNFLWLDSRRISYQIQDLISEEIKSRIYSGEKF